MRMLASNYLERVAYLCEFREKTDKLCMDVTIVLEKTRTVDT